MWTINGVGLGTTNFQVGDPEWIGVLERPDAPHGPNNKFIARYAFIAVPVGNTLDLNAIHNQARLTPDHGKSNCESSSRMATCFFRNQGVGSWEINLAAFLADLNTNQWGSRSSTFTANDFTNTTIPANCKIKVALLTMPVRLLAYRYNNNYNTLAPVGNICL